MSDFFHGLLRRCGSEVLSLSLSEVPPLPAAREAERLAATVATEAPAANGSGKAALGRKPALPLAGGTPAVRPEEAPAQNLSGAQAPVEQDPWTLPPRTESVRLSAIFPLLGQTDKHSHVAEQYRILRTKMVQLLRKPFWLVITSPGVGDGKTVTAVNLAAAMAWRNGERTLLVDGDLRRASVHRMLRVPPQPGLAEVLAGKCRLDEAIFVAAGLPGLHVLCAGNAEGNPTELLGSDRWQEVAEEARRHFAHVILDSPPLEVVADFDLIAAVCEKVLLVVRPDHSNRALTLTAIEKLQPKLTGVLINAAQDWFLWRRPAHDRYYYYRPESSRSGRTKNEPGA